MRISTAANRSCRSRRNPPVAGLAAALAAAICCLFLSLGAQAAPTNADLIVCEGRVAEVSKLPDVSELAYPDCNYTAVFEIVRVVKNDRKSSLPPVVQLLVPGFRQKKPCGLPPLLKNRSYRIAMLPDERISSEQRSITRVDDLTRFDLDDFYVVSVEKSAVGPRPAAAAAPPAAAPAGGSGPEVRSAVPEPLKRLQQAAIDVDKRRNLERLEYFSAHDPDEINRRFSEAFRKCGRSYSPYRGPYRVEYHGYPVVTSAASMRFRWGRIGDCFFALPEDWRLVRYADHRIMPQNVRALKSLRELLERHGVQLIVELIPDLHDIAARVMVRGFEDVPDYDAAAVAATLLDAGIETVYTSDRFLKDRFCRELLFFYPGNSHPHDGAQEILTSIMAERLKRYGDALPARLAREDFSIRREPSCYGKNYSWPPHVDIGGHKSGETDLCEYIYYRGARLDNDPDSPILVLGNSFIQTPQDRRSYCDRLALHTGINPCELRSQLPALPALIWKDPARWLKGRKVCILAVGARHFFTVERIADAGLLAAAKKLNETPQKPLFALKYPSGLENPQSSICASAVGTTAPGVLIRNRKAGEWETAWQITVPPDRLKKKLEVLLTLSVLPGSRCRLELCSVEHEVANLTDEVQLRSVVFSATPRNVRENLRIRSDDGHAVLLLHEIQLFK